MGHDHSGYFQKKNIAIAILILLHTNVLYDILDKLAFERSRAKVIVSVVFLVKQGHGGFLESIDIALPPSFIDWF